MIRAIIRSKEAANLLREGRALLQKGENGKAAKLFERILHEFAETSSAELAQKELRGLSSGERPPR